MIYFDHAATTPLDPSVLDAMVPYYRDVFGNPSSAYAGAREARKAIDAARDRVASILGCHGSEVIFTSGGSESDNLAIKGVAFANPGRRHIVTTSVEHHAVLNTCEFLERHFGYEVTFLPVDQCGMISPDDVQRAIRPDTVVVSMMLANNEVGTIQPLAEVARIAGSHGIPIHTDAVQGAASLDLNVDKLGVDLLSLSAHKFNGPKGVGILYVRRGTAMLPQQQGGGQERGMRAGTENTAGIVGAAVALELAANRRETYVRHCSELRDVLIAEVLENVEDAVLTGHPTERLANNASFAFAGADGEALLMALDAEDIAASIGSACTSGTLEVSHVLRAMGLDDLYAGGSLRLTVGAENTRDQVEELVELLPNVVDRARAARRMTLV